MKMESEWQTYRTRFLVQAKQLDASLRFYDSLGREHSGVAGDYLVEFADGVLRIAPRELFEDIYVPMETARKKRPCSAVPDRNHFDNAALRSKMLSS
ncbi:MAG: hypothetical protein ABSE92_17680 [Terriglobales bacterium]|jgi:hypothetical protein